MSNKEVAESLLVDCRHQGILLEADGDHLIVDAPQDTLTASIVAGLQEHKRELLDLLNLNAPVYETSSNPEENRGLGYVYRGDTAESDVGWIDKDLAWDELPEPIDCSECGRFDCWWNLLGERRCTKCQPPAAASRRWLATAERIRHRCRSGQDTSAA